MRAGVCFCDEDVRTVSEGGQLEETLRAQNKSEQSCLTAKEKKGFFFFITTNRRSHHLCEVNVSPPHPKKAKFESFHGCMTRASQVSTVASGPWRRLRTDL